jgi:demethylmenaquinone methyltransferase/2-methoxy-6-polyprenyl-1,4-benzoquinol methylase
MDESARTVQRLFSRIARKYDLMNRILSFGQDKKWRRLLARKLSEKGVPHRALDVCAGTADLALRLAAIAGHSTRVVALDFSREMLGIARAKIRRANAAERVLPIEGDALALPFEDHTFDAVVMAFGLRNLSNTEQGLREMARVTRPGGRVAVLEFALPNSFLRRQTALLFLRIVRLLIRSKAYNHLWETIEQFPGPPVLRAALERCGIANVETWQRMFGLVTLYRGTVK